MRIDTSYKRRIRIECKPDAPHGRRTHITDLETGEEITNITRILLQLDAGEVNVAQVTYVEYDETGKIATEQVDDELEPLFKTVLLKGSELDITAFEEWAEEQAE